MISLHTRALLLLRRPPCWNKHGAARTTRHVTTHTTRRACRAVTPRSKWSLGFCAWVRDVVLTSDRLRSLLFANADDIVFGSSVKIVKFLTAVNCSTR